jgi:hypothetical protein
LGSTWYSGPMTQNILEIRLDDSFVAPPRVWEFEGINGWTSLSGFGPLLTGLKRAE